MEGRCASGKMTREVTGVFPARLRGVRA
jgi:hypothetical protein